MGSKFPAYCFLGLLLVLGSSATLAETEVITNILERLDVLEAAQR